ncbi:MAG: hypothetical protein H7256_12390 [Bdellovibrio sp.]|nr:hypothetical protein [Bdellovibrio sp.]
MSKFKKGFAYTVAVLLSQGLTLQSAFAFQMVDLNQIDQAGGAPAVVSQPVNYNSKYFIQTLSNAVCTDVLGAISNSGANQTRYQQLDQLIDALSVECGVMSENENPNIDFQAVGFKFEGSNTFILWDGQSITVNEQAQAIFEMTMSPSFNNIIFIKKTDIDSKKQNKILDRITDKLVKVRSNLKTIYKDGQTQVIIAGYAYHDRRTYTPEKIKQLNERAYGIGIEKVLINENGNRESLFAMIFKDSHRDLEPSVGYEWQHPFRVTKNIKVLAGYSAGITMRSDFNYVPIPYVFPTAGLSIGKLDIKGVLIPSLGGINNGNVLFLFGSMPIKN